MTRNGATEYSKAATRGNWNEVWEAFDRRRGAQTAGVAAANEDDAQGLPVGVAAE